MDNRCVVTRKLGGVPSKNHHGDLISTPPKKSAAQKFRPAGPIRATDTNRTTCINSDVNRKMPRVKKPYSASICPPKYSECWEPWSALVGLARQSVLVIHSSCELFNKNHEKYYFSTISLIKRWNHWRKKPLKSYPQSVHYALLPLRNPTAWTDSGCPDKYMKTQCN